MIRWPDYSAHDALIAPARRTCAPWRLVLGLVFVAVAYLGLGLMFFRGVGGFAHSDVFFDDLLGGGTPIAMFVLLGSFGFLTLSVWGAVHLVHRRSFLSLLGPKQLLIPQFLSVSGVVILLGVVVFILPPWDMGGGYVPNLSLGMWLVLLPISILAVLVQVSAEEILFRGYIQQQLAARFRSPLVWMVLPAGLFALGHYVPATAGDNAVLIALWAGVFGILMADITARAGSLGPAIALHLWNNVSAIVIVSLPDDLHGLALFHTPFDMSDTDAVRAWLPVDFALMLVTWLAARLAIRR